MAYLLSVLLLILVLVINGLLALSVLLRSPSKKLNTVFALLTFSFMAWSATSFYEQTTKGTNHLLPLLAGIPFVCAVLIAFFFTLFSFNFPERRFDPPLSHVVAEWTLGATTVIVIGSLLFAKLIVAGVTTSPAAGNNIVLGPLYALFPIYFLGWMGAALINLYAQFRKATNRNEKQQLNYIFLGLLLTTIVGFLTNVIVPLLTGDATSARFGFLATVFLSGFVGYAIAAHHLFNIRLLVARSITYLLLLGTTTILYGLGVFAVSSVFFPHTGVTFGEIITFVALALVLAITYQPLRRFFERITDRLFFRYRYNPQNLLNSISNVLASELLLERLLTKSLKEICTAMHVAGGQFVVLESRQLYKETHLGSFPRQPITLETTQELNHLILIADELQPGKLKDLLDEHGIRVSLMLRERGEPVGYLFLGDKLSGGAYSDQDLAILEILRKELAIAIANAQAYEEIARFNRTLQERIRKATQRLSSANRNLKVLDKAKDDFISMASHQLGTPLTAITGYLSMTIDEDKNNMTIQQREYVTFALEASERMLSMSSDLLNVSRLNSGRFMIQRQFVDLARLVQQEVQQLRPAAERKGLELTFEPPTPPLPRLTIDESKTRQVIMNFIDNAIYYTIDGGIHIELAQTSDYIRLTVTDTGIGVPSGEQSKLFTKFYRAENAKSLRPDGTGLGLYLAKRVIEEQGGAIIFVSTEDKGSTFGFTLPL